jgi:short-subunit dehydrogenase
MGATGRGWDGIGAVVTGASSGIGAAIARQLASAGAALTLNGRNAERLDAVATACRETGAAAATVVGDLTDGAVRARIVGAALALHGGIDLLVNNAGLTMNARFAELQPVVLRRVVEVDFFATVELTRLALPALRERKGRILVVSSLTGLVGPPTRTAYAAAKHALHGFFDALRIELRDDGVSVTIACPGFVDTPMRIHAVLGDGSEQGRDQASGRQMLTADRVAAASLRAASRRQRMILLGRETRIARLLSILAPSLLDRVLAKSTR